MTVGVAYGNRPQGNNVNQRFENRNRNDRNDHGYRCKSGGERSQSTSNPPDTERSTVRISSLRMTPVDLPYVPILNETFITALWDTGAEKSYTSEEVYHRYYSYRPRQKTKDRVVTAQEAAPYCHLGRVELQIRIRYFQKTWEFHILDNMQYQCILEIDFLKVSKLTLDFDKKYLVIPDDQIKSLRIVEKPV
ncbi:uncharacterized protein TNCV_4438291 [Trichonephila clavipes]|nr:uncharacterized protein TNCV_4438291 [Trichonephila clavipes]